MDQLSFASLDFAAKKKRTKRDVFLAEMERGNSILRADTLACEREIRGH